MAVRNKNAQPDGTIVERRLRPIYDWLDIGNNKKALQEVEKVLKKSPTLQAAKALKALALLRLGKGQEAYSVLEQLAAEKPCDDSTLQAMTISYRETHQLHKVCELYENAVKEDPNNEELHSHLFMSYVRIGDYKSQQIAAMALYKFAPKNPYYFWAVMSIVLQAKSTEDQTKKKILLTLAQRMVDNFIADNKMEAEQEARLYIMILELQEKWADVLNFLKSPLYNKLVSGTTPQQTIPYLRKLGDWRKLNILCRELLLENQDRWDFYMPYFDSVFQLMKETQGPIENDGETEFSIDDTAEKCHEFLCTIVESMSSNRTLRGPYLARLELFKRLSVDGDPTSLLGSGLALCLQYLRVFAHKACAVPDLRPYVLMISEKEREEHCREFLTCFGFDENSTPEKSDDIQRHVNCLILWRLCAPVPSASTSLQLAATLKSHYLRCLRENVLYTSVTEFSAADAYAILAAHHYFYAAVEQKSSKPILESVCLLELVLNKSPANFHVKLLLVQLYHVLGNALAADVIYQRLDVKHIQLVSLGWLHSARLPAAACPARALQLLADTRAFHHHHAKDSVEHLTFAYKFGTFEKLGEVGAWQARVGACSARALAERDCALLASAHERDVAALRHLPLPMFLTDNRDLNVIVDYSSTGAAQPPAPRVSHEQDTALVHLKDCLVIGLSLCAHLAKDSKEDVRRAQRELLRECAEKFSNDMLKFKPICSPEDIFISRPFPSRIIAFVNSPVPYRELYSTLLTMFATVSDDSSLDGQAACSQVVQLVAGSADGIRQVVEAKLGGDDPVWFMRDVLEDLSNYLEFIGYITQTLTLTHELLTPANAKKQKRKLTQTQDQLETSQLINKLNDTVRHCIKTTEDLFHKLPEYQVLSFEQEMNNLKLSDTFICPVQQRLRNGRNDMVNDILNILEKKSKHLQGLVRK